MDDLFEAIADYTEKDRLHSRLAEAMDVIDDFCKRLTNLFVKRGQNVSCRPLVNQRNHISVALYNGSDFLVCLFVLEIIDEGDYRYKIGYNRVSGWKEVPLSCKQTLLENIRAVCFYSECDCRQFIQFYMNSKAYKKVQGIQSNALCC